MNTKTIFLFTALSINLIAHGSPAPASIKNLHSHTQQELTCPVEMPESLYELTQCVMHTKGPLSVAGARASQGGHIWSANGTALDMTKMNRILDCDPALKTITVEAGIRWKDIQEFLAPKGLAVMTMQSYNDFTVGGSLSVNAHGRMAHGQIMGSVVGVKVVLADGSLVTATRQQNHELFQAVIGGYGACGIIVEATLNVVENDHIERIVKHMSLSEYKTFFTTSLVNNSQVVLHNANIVLPACDKVESITWYKTKKSLTTSDYLQPDSPDIKLALLRKCVERIPFAQYMRRVMENKFMYNHELVTWRSYEMSYSITSLKLLSTPLFKNILQEYFIPIDNLELFVKQLSSVLKKYSVNALNVSIRYVPGNTESVLSYAPKDSFAFVLYVNIAGSQKGHTQTQKWTQELITHALSCDGTYYLPYALFATQQQFEKAYPRHAEFKRLRKKYDPNNRFGNTFLNTYLA